MTTRSNKSSAKTSMARAGEFLAAQLIDGDHIEVEVDGTRYVDYDATSDVLFALRALGEQPRAIRKISAFLLHPRSVAAYAHGKPYETSAARLREPLARLALVARFWRAGGHAPRTIDKTLSRLDSTLAGLASSDGRFADTGEHADRSSSTTRHSWAVLATAAADGDGEVLDSATDELLAVQCTDGTFAAVLGAGPCGSGDVAATSLALQALTGQAPMMPVADAVTAGSALPRTIRPVNVPPAAWSKARAKAVQDAAVALLTRTDSSGLPVEVRDRSVVGALAAGRQFVGLDASNGANALAEQQVADGGLPRRAGGRQGDFETTLAAGYAIAGKSWTGAARSPVAPAVRLPLAEQSAPRAVAAGELPRHTSQKITWVLGGLVLLTLLGWALSRFVPRRPRSKGSTS
ncbi:hypothetical protein [Aeromicrobium sp. UC242_57]|uniref:hypothetical protein n=1 Tax=Aeromicrobium sp. UC242_57 TaxID=3374624 RepID=UPI003795225B